MLNNITPQDEKNYQSLLQTLENKNPTTFCNEIGLVKSSLNKSQTRDKKRAIGRIKKALILLNKLGIEVTLKAKESD